jgi:hypothetical protein
MHGSLFFALKGRVTKEEALNGKKYSTIPTPA